MLKVASLPTFARVCTVAVPAGDGIDEQTCKATYRVIGNDELANYDLLTVEGLTAFLRATLRHIDDLGDDDGRPVAYSDELRDKLLDVPYVRNALMQGYLAGISGAKAGN